MIPKPQPAPAPPILPPDSSPGSALLVSVNAARAEAGLPALAPEPTLARVASAWSSAMARRWGLTHNELGGVLGSVAGATAAGECIAAGQQTAGEVVADWMSDKPHRDIVLGMFTHGGCGVAARPGDGTLFWTLDVVRVG